MLFGTPTVRHALCRPGAFCHRGLDSFDFVFVPESFGQCWARTAGGGRAVAAARPRSRIVIAAAAASATHPAPTISARRTVGAPITTGHTPMRVEDPIV